MKDYFEIAVIAVGGLLLVVAAFALVVAFYGALIGGLLGAGWLVFKAITGL